MLMLKTYSLGPLYNNSYLLWDDDTGLCLIIDAPIESEKLLHDIELLNLSPIYLLNTHCHFDHVWNNAFFKKQTGVKLAYHKADEIILLRMVQSAESFGFKGAEPSPLADFYLKDNDELKLGSESIKPIWTPGHSPGSVTFLTSIGAFVGDVLFREGIGRYDLPGSSPEELYESLTKKLFRLPEDTVVYPGHGEKTTIGHEKKSNPFISLLSEEIRRP